MRQTTDTAIDIAKWLGGAAAGALLMVLLDPDRGSARRARSAATVRALGTRTSDTLGDAWQRSGARIRSAAADARAGAAELVDAMRPDAADAAASSGVLARAGQAAGTAMDDGGHRVKDTLARAGAAVEEGVAKARDTLHHAHEAAGDGLARAGQGARRVRARVHDAVQPGPAGEWKPALRGSALAGGGLLAMYGLVRRSPLGLVLGLAGAALLARGAANRPLPALLRGRGLALHLDQTIDLEKTIHIDAAPGTLYDFWTDYENFPRFMSHVAEVRDLGRGRSHWVVRGPGGSAFEWHSTLTEQSRPHRLAWRSEPGAEIPQSGSVQFEARDGGTDVTVRMSYTPPAGALGHGLATLLGADPDAAMDDDLARMKAFVEGAAVRPGAARSGLISRLLH